MPGRALDLQALQDIIRHNLANAGTFYRGQVGNCRIEITSCDVTARAVSRGGCVSTVLLSVLL
jgi:hypothetical protein